jgi:hypothetical protein
MSESNDEMNEQRHSQELDLIRDGSASILGSGPDPARRGQDRMRDEVESTIPKRWVAWRKCHYTREFAPFAASGIHHAFHAISDRITNHAQSVVDRLDLRNPLIDQAAVEFAMQRFLREWHERPRPMRWFPPGWKLGARLCAQALRANPQSRLLAFARHRGCP